jgi:hypothetical protein
MSRYFFHTEGNHLHTDEEGTDLPTLYAARAEAMQMAGEMLREGTLNDQVPDGVPWRLWVTEGPGAAGATVLSIHILVQSGPPETVRLAERSTARVFAGS